MSWLPVYVGLCPHLSIALAFASLPDLLELGCLLSFQPNRAFNHEQNPIAISPCSSSSALDGSREPGRDVGGTRAKIVAWAKNLWDRYLTPVDLQVVSGYV